MTENERNDIGQEKLKQTEQEFSIFRTETEFLLDQLLYAIAVFRIEKTNGKGNFITSQLNKYFISWGLSELFEISETEKFIASNYWADKAFFVLENEIPYNEQIYLASSEKNINLTLRKVGGASVSCIAEEIEKNILHHHDFNSILSPQDTVDVVWDIDLKKELFYLSPSWREILGYSGDDLDESTKTIKQLIHPEDFVKLMRKAKRYTTDPEGGFEYKFRILHKDGHWILVQAKVLRNIIEDGEITRMIGTLTDISGLSSMHMSLKRQIARYQSLFDYSPLGVFHFNEEAIITDSNHKFAEILGISPKHIFGTHLQHLKNEEIIEQIQNSLVKGQGYYEGVYESDNLNRKLTIRLFLKTIKIEGADKIEGIGLLEDVTEQKKLELSLKESTEKYKAQYENFPVPVFIWQKKGDDFVMVSANKAAQKDSDNQIHTIFNIPSRQIWKDEPALTDHLFSCYNSQTSFAIERLYTFQASGKEQFVTATYGYLPPDSVQITTVNITEKEETSRQLKQREQELQRQNENYELINSELQRSLEQISEINQQLNIAKRRAEESDRLKSAFLANISHEIRTPMNGIIGFAQMLKMSGVTEEKRYEYIDIINDSGEQLLRILNDIVDISKIEVGQIDVHIEQVFVKNIFEELFAFYCQSAWKKGLEFRLKLPDNAENDIMSVDVTMFKRILSGLISNAIKFTGNGYVQMSYQRKDDFYHFKIKDTGIGIAPEAIDRVFLRFQQENSMTRIRYGGTGLGLSISKAFIEKLGGEISLKTRLNQGSSFSFCLPVHSEEATNNMENE